MSRNTQIDKVDKGIDYKCEKCQDTGYIQKKDGNNGFIIKDCQCKINKRINEKLKDSKIPLRFKNDRIENFKTPNESYKNSKDHAKVFIKNIDKFISNNWGLFLRGKPSTGKSNLQAIIMNHLCVDNDYTGIMVNVTKLLRRLKGAIKDNSLNDLLDTINKCQIIALNDITGGKRPQDEFTSWERTILYDIFDSIYEEKKAIIITGKFNYQWIEDKLGTDIVDRIKEMCGEGLVLEGKNWREEAGDKRDDIVNQMLKEII